MDEQVRAALANNGMTQDVQYDDVHVGLFGSVTFDHVVFGSSGNATFDNVVVSSIDRDAFEKGVFPTYGSVAFHGYKLAMTEGEMRRSVPMLYQLGYRKIQGDMNVSYQYSPEEKRLDIQEASVAMDEHGKLSGHLSIRMPLDSLKNPNQVKAALESARLKTAGLKLENDGLVERGFAMSEKQDHKNREQVLADLEQQIQRSPQENQKKALTAFRDFLAGGHEIGVSITTDDMHLSRVVAAFSRADLRGMDLEFNGS